MRKILVMLILILMVCLCACASAEPTYTITKDNVDYVVDTENKTISDGIYTYQYEFSGNSSSYDVDITYPDGSIYWFTMSGNSGHGGWSDDYDEKRYIDGDTLCDVLLEKAPKESKPGKIFAVVLLAALGVFNVVSPYSAWYLEYGWRYKNAEPSDMALGMNRVGGVIAVIAAILVLFML